MTIRVGNRSYRKHCAALCRNGVARLRVYGSRGEWHLATEREVGRETVVVPVTLKSYPTIAKAQIDGLRRFSIKATQIKSLRAAA